ncbi:MAG: hypothetical protein HY726_20220 [Candidatus Rokubacteria bacterium]|nr:hypothetical protein [Candidatus Rokubacteria bacterium]
MPLTAIVLARRTAGPPTRDCPGNDTNRRGPGQGDNRFAPVFAARVRHGYAGVVSVEPFDYDPDGPATAARAIGYIRGILETLAWRA